MTSSMQIDYTELALLEQRSKLRELDPSIVSDHAIGNLGESCYNLPCLVYTNDSLSRPTHGIALGSAPTVGELLPNLFAIS